MDSCGGANFIRLRASCAALLLLVVLFASCQASFGQLPHSDRSTAQAGDTPKIGVANYICWWVHDATGYHPAIFVRFRNDSNADLSGAHISWQAKFMDVRYGQVTVARAESVTLLGPGQQQTVMLKGPNSFELLIDKATWPSLECKVMCRVGQVGDEGTQDLLVGKLNQVVMTEDEAAGELARRPDMKRAASADDAPPQPAPQMPRKNRKSPAALLATVPMLPLSAANKIMKVEKTVKTPADNQPLLTRFLSSKLPGIGDEYSTFEKYFGLPTSYGASPASHWTWVRYSPHNAPLDLYAGSKSGATAADVIVVSIPSTEVQQESQIITLAKALAGKYRSQVPEQAHKSVKYLPTGRVEFSSLSGATFHIIYFPPLSRGTDESHYILVLSREPGDIVQKTPDYLKGVDMLRFLQPLLGN